MGALWRNLSWKWRRIEFLTGLFIDWTGDGLDDDLDSSRIIQIGGMMDPKTNLDSKSELGSVSGRMGIVNQ